MNELKPEDVMRALECCASGTGGDACNDCPFNERKVCDNDMNALEKAALALIREKDALLEEWDAKCKDYETDLLGKCMDIEKLKAYCDEKDAEIERLREIIVKGDYSSHTARLATETWHRNNSEFIHRLEAEIERLKAKCEALKEESDINRYNCRQYEEAADTARADAITEFAERLKTFYRHLKGNTASGSVEYHIDQVLKEMREKK